MNDLAIGQAIADANYALMVYLGTYIGWVLAFIFITLGLVGLSPLKVGTDFNFAQVALVFYRKTLFLLLVLIALVFLGMYAFYISMNDIAPSIGTRQFLIWLGHLAKENAALIVGGSFAALAIRFVISRYLYPFISKLWRNLRIEQSKDKLDDIRDRSEELEAFDYLPQKYYGENHVFLGLTEDHQPITIPDEIWTATHMQIIGPTQYGKGVVIGTILDQQIRKGRGVLYVDPKGDKHAPHIMCKAAHETGRQFIYLDLSDDGIGSWAPFRGGNERDALTRLEMAYSLEYTGDPGTDYHKSQERKGLDRAFKTTREIKQLKLAMEGSDANRIDAELSRWSSIATFCPAEGSGFNMDEAILNNAVVYVRGSLDDSIIKSATTIFIAEHIQAAKRLHKQVKSGIDVVIDEVSALVSKTLAMSLATTLGFNIRFALAYQSQKDLLNIEDNTVSGQYVHNSINVNCQIKAVYGGADFETADWIAKLSGTILKSLPKMERSEINASGGEVWAGSRFIGTEETSLISVNTVLALRPRIGVLISPRQLARLCFTAFVPVDTVDRLNNFIDSLANEQEPAIEPAQLENTAQSVESNAIKKERRLAANAKMNTVPGVVSSKSTDASANSTTTSDRQKEKNKDRKKAQQAKKKAARNAQQQTGSNGDEKSVMATDGDC